jgi:hypothetical protein
MFKNLLAELEQLSRTTSVNVPLEHDAEGYSDKECPSEACLFGFKVYGEDWPANDAEIFCPSCRHCAPTTSWFTREQIQGARERVVKQVQGKINGAMKRDARDWNGRQPRNSFLKMTMSVTGGTTSFLLPVPAAEPMRLKTKCEFCNCRYSYVGAAFFCPCCGQNSAHQTFQQTLETIRAIVGTKAVLAASLDADQTEVLYRSLLEKGFQDTVMAFQRLAEQLYSEIPGVPSPRRNVFQNLDSGAELWSAAKGATYGDILSSEASARLRVYFQQRHLLAHSQAIVDEDYISKSGDSTYAVGQRLVLKESALLDFVAIINDLGSGLINLMTP